VWIILDNHIVLVYNFSGNIPDENLGFRE
jgi:hypothetical protein